MSLRHDLAANRVSTELGALRQISPAMYSDVIGKPFKWGGRGPDNFDCYGLVRFLLIRNGIYVPDYPSNEDGSVNAAVILMAMQDFTPSSNQAGAIAAFKMDKPDATHVGLLLDSDRFIHITDKTCVVIERISSPLWKRRVAGFYQWPH